MEAVYVHLGGVVVSMESNISNILIHDHDGCELVIIYNLVLLCVMSILVMLFNIYILLHGWLVGGTYLKVMRACVLSSLLLTSCHNGEEARTS